MYQHNILLVPHGDDFRYQSDTEWTKQTGNLKKLFQYMNKHPDMYIQASLYFIYIKIRDIP